jgi:hypothetical protein
MNDIFKIFPFLRKKIDIVCYNEKEWYNVQIILFYRGYYWEHHGKRIWEPSEWKYPRVLKNYRTGDKFGNNILILDSYSSKKYLNIITINAISYIRNLKLKKILNQNL